TTPAVAAPAPDYDASVVEITVTYQDHDPQIPWRKKASAIRQGYGVFISPGQVLTTEDLVRNQTQVELRRAKSGAKLAATVLEADDQLNTALLTFSNSAAANAPVPMALADTIRRDDRLTIVKLEKTGEFQTSEGQVVELSASASPRPLALKVLTQSSIDGNGTPALLNGQLAGLSVAYDKKTQTGLFIPCTTLRRFIADANAPPYKGLAWAGFQFEPLLDPVKRRYLGVSETKGGIVVTKTTPGSGAAEVLQTGDVITAWDGIPIDAQGYYTDTDFGRLRLAYLIGGRRAAGDSVPVALVRDQKPRAAQVLLKRQRDCDEFIPEAILPGQSAPAEPGGGEPVEYLVEGGLVLRELTGNYLRAAGENWKLQVNPRLVYYYLHQDKFVRQSGDHVVLLSMVLPDSINIGYQEFHDQVVTAVNGQPIRNMADVFRAVDGAGGLRRVALLGCGVDLALDETTLNEANRRIAAQYRIPRLRFQKKTPAD
ncbi:MAG: trypsin-like peptidase domain-containing protein, partial [Kiritimatiellota bacterium]|nr:trypsin-like peptidase domain-containing protein [Kiritimatiellota bacterium]